MQILRRRDPDGYTAEKLDLADRQLTRIQRTIRELVDFSRPASTVVGRVRLADAVDEALGIAKYYQRTKDRAIAIDVPADLPPVVALRDHITQVVLNLVMNAVDATGKGGEIRVVGRDDGGLGRAGGRGRRPRHRARPITRGSSSPISPPSRAGRASACSSAARSSRSGAVGSGSSRSRASGTTFTVRLPAVAPEPPRPIAAAVEGVIVMSRAEAAEPRDDRPPGGAASWSSTTRR